MVKCNKYYYAADDMPLLSHDHLSRLHWHTVPAVLWQRINTHQKPWCAATRMPNGNPNQISIIKCWSMLFLLIKTGWAAKRWLQQLHCSAAAVVRCSSGGRTRRELRSCVLWNTSGRAEPWGARLWPASSRPDKESSLQLFLPASYSSPPLHGHWTNPELLEGTLHITCYAALLNAA